ncbi:hypothetical protein GJ744_003904 [Endocarpon pusillum]|uniref:F-box domain-containing protein n=1 Tax=Endocarpon pusillum TaxID=364733 RepID=A0A8H7DZ46_9EURO|nr:hypothetical protein GJ744_003904 [Endocarpon pusillum]
MSGPIDLEARHGSKGSSAFRLANSFRRASNTSTAPDSQKNDAKRTGGRDAAEPPRRASLADLPLRLIRSKSKTTEDIQKDVERPAVHHKLGDLFFTMPNEIQVQILCSLETSDILSLRLASKPLCELLQLNASIVSRVVLQKSSLGSDPMLLEKLYRPPLPVQNLDFFLQMMHRKKIVSRMICTIANYVQLKIYQVRSTNRRKQFAPSRARMESRLEAPTFIIHHFLETFRTALLRPPGIANSDSSSTSAEPMSSETEIQTSIINDYPQDMLLPAFQFYRIMVSAYRQKLRPPTYAGTIERKIRGWDRTPASDADVTQVLIYGGMEEVLRVMSHPTYATRLQALNLAIDRINGRPLPVGSRWMKVKSRSKVIRDLDMPQIPKIQYMSQGSPVKLTALYLPWLSAIVAKQKKMDGAEGRTPASQSSGAPTSSPQIPSPFAYIEDLLRDHQAGSASGETDMTVEDFAARASAPDGEGEDVDDTVAGGPDHAAHGFIPQNHPSSFPT